MLRYDQFESQEISTAYHEAGHAVVCLVLGMAVKHVTIIPEENGLGLIVHETAIDGTDDVALACAGPAAELLFRQLVNDEPVSFAVFDDIVEHEVTALLPGLNMNNVEVGECWDVAEDIIVRHARGVIAIADALLEKRFLHGDEVQALWEASTAKETSDA